MKNTKIAIGSDHAGFELKEIIKQKLQDMAIDYYDFGTYDKTLVDYPIIAKDIAKRVADGNFDRGIII